MIVVVVVVVVIVIVEVVVEMLPVKRSIAIFISHMNTSTS